MCPDQPPLHSIFNLRLWLCWLASYHSALPTTHHLQHLCCFGSILALGAYLRTVLVEQKRDRQAPKHQKRRNGARPLISEIRIHLGGKQRKCSSEQGPKHRTGRQHRSSIDGICTQVSKTHCCWGSRSRD
jgi:hypothetical protein